MRPPLETNLARLRARIERACRETGRDPRGIELVAVTKGVPAELALDLVPLGQVDLGESRVPELEGKAAAARAARLDVRWHLVGHLQRNKARRAVRTAQVIHSVDSLELLETLGRVALEEGVRPDILLEVRTPGEDAPGRHGFAPEALPAAVRRAAELEGLRLLGLMALAPRPDPSAADPHARAAQAFGELARLARGLEADPAARAAFGGGRVRLSMGMSGDLEHAIAAGADILRVGSALFAGLSPTLGGPARGAETEIETEIETAEGTRAGSVRGAERRPAADLDAGGVARGPEPGAQR